MVSGLDLIGCLCALIFFSFLSSFFVMRVHNFMRIAYQLNHFDPFWWKLMTWIYYSNHKKIANLKDSLMGFDGVQIEAITINSISNQMQKNHSLRKERERERERYRSLKISA